MSIRNDLLERILSAIQSGSGLTGRVNVTSAAQLSGTLDSSKEYFIDGIIDMGSQSIEVPAGGLYLSGYNFDTSKLISSADNYTMFTSPVGGSGNILGRDLTLTTSGTNSSLWGITGATGGEAIEFDKVNFNDCTSLGYIDNYRQYLEVGSGRFGGTPVLEFRGAWSGARISTSIVRGLSNLSSIFKAGAGLTYPTELNHISRTVNNLVGPNDVAFFPLNFIANLAKGDRVRVEVENKTSSDNVTARQDSFIILTEV